MFHFEKDNVKVGAYLKLVILNNFTSIRKFCRAYLELRDGSADDEEIRKLLNRFSQILKGTKRIQTDDLPYISELLQVSCEEILSAGRNHAPVSSHVTNYDIAFSNDRETWERYMKREDKLFLNCDEYCKSVIDYALEFKNYGFIKYLIDEKYIWFVDLTKWRSYGFTYGAGTSIKRRDVGSVDSYTPNELCSQDRLRTQTIALAIESDDYDILDELLAREIPEMKNTVSIYPNVDYQPNKDEKLIRAVADASEKILSYFSEEFTVKNTLNQSNKFVFPFIGDVIDVLIENGKYDSAEIVIKKMIRHNRSVLDQLTALIDDAFEFYRNDPYLNFNGADDYLKKQVIYNFSYDSVNDLAAFFYVPEKHKSTGMVSNIVYVNSDKGNASIKKLIIELNSLYDSVIALKGDDSK